MGTITEPRVEEEIARLLTKFRIVPGQAKPVTDALLREVKAARDKRGELMADVRRVLRANTADRMLRDPYHTARPGDALLAADLEKRRVLWLTGRSLSGKTHTGQLLAQTLQDRGVGCLETMGFTLGRSPFFSPPPPNARRSRRTSS